MKTSQFNVYKPGTFENDIGAMVSELMGDNQGPLSQLLRRVLFANPKEGDDSEHNIDWDLVAYYVGVYFPEKNNEIAAIRTKYGF